MSGLVIFGTRPEAIKLAPVVRFLRETPVVHDLQVVSSGQHAEILDQTLGALAMNVDVNLDIMQPNQEPAEVLERAIGGLNKAYEGKNVEWVLVQGDTATALAGALFGYFLKVPVIHLEAGLRTHDTNEPWPEEGIRQNISRLATLHLAPYPRARQNLIDEGVAAPNIKVIGNPGLDTQDATFQQAMGNVNSLAGRDKFFLVTLHRRENLGERLLQTCKQIQELLAVYPDHKVIWPLHPNPRVRSMAIKVFGENVSQVELCPPFDYPDFLFAQHAASMIISDSGGVQEEGATFGTGVAVVREKTERQEVVELGLAKVVGGNAARLTEVAREFVGVSVSRDKVERWRVLQGNGQAAAVAGVEICRHIALPYASSARLA